MKKNAKIWLVTPGAPPEEVGRAMPLEGLRPEAAGGMAAISALTGEGIPELLHLLDHKLSEHLKVYDISLSLSDGAALSWLYAHGKVIYKRDTKTKSNVKVELSPADYGRFVSRFGEN